MININIFRTFLNGFFRIYCKILFRAEIKGLENIPKEGPVIFCGNHVSTLDAILVEVFTPRKMRFLGKEEIQKNIFLKTIAKTYEMIPVKRDSKDLSSVKESLKTLKSGGCLGIFPEGTRNGLEKNNGEMKNGATYLAIKTGASIVPIGIKGKIKPFHKVTVTYGKKIEYTKYLNQKITKEIEDNTTKQLKEAIIELTK